MKIKLNKDSTVKLIEWNMKSSVAMIVVKELDGFQNIYKVEIGANNCIILKVSLFNVHSSYFSSNIHFDNDGLFYFGDKMGQVHVLNQLLDTEN